MKLLVFISSSNLRYTERNTLNFRSDDGRNGVKRLDGEFLKFLSFWYLASATTKSLTLSRRISITIEYLLFCYWQIFSVVFTIPESTVPEQIYSGRDAYHHIHKLLLNRSTSFWNQSSPLQINLRNCHFLEQYVSH